MPKSNTKVIVIDDILTETDVRLINLRRYFEEVFLENNPENGVEFVKENKLEKLIVVLDYQFGENQKTGVWVLDKIRKESFVIPVILMTENQHNLKQSEFPNLINDKLSAFADKSDYRDLVKKVKEADEELNTKVEVALEDWINRHSPEDKEKPYLKTKNGKSYRDMERKILNLVIELLANDIKRL